MNPTFSDINNLTFNDVENFLNNNSHIKYFQFPSFRSYIAQQKEQYEVLVKEEGTHMKQYIRIAQILVIADNIRVIHDCWTDIQPDHFNNYFELFKLAFKLNHLEEGGHYRGISNPKVAEWLREHCSGQRFLNMLYQHCKREGKNLLKDHKEPTFMESKFGRDEDYILAKTTTDPEVLHKLAVECDYGVRYQVAKNVNTNSETLTMLVTDPFIGESIASHTTEAVALHANTPTEIKKLCYLDLGTQATERTLTDTLKQLEEMRNKNLEVPTHTTDEDGNIKKIRWRLTDLHDHISYLYLCQSVENVPFANVTLKKSYVENEWTVYSPQDSLQLATWAHKVGNCVRQREGRVHAGQSEIICIEENGEPRYTVEINGPSDRKAGGLNIVEIQRKGLGPGMTKDNNNFVYNLIQRALENAEELVTA